MAPTSHWTFSRWHMLWSFPHANSPSFCFLIFFSFKTPARIPFDSVVCSLPMSPSPLPNLTKLFTTSHVGPCVNQCVTFGIFWSCSRYNYDVVKDAPMDGRYEWVRVGPWHDPATASRQLSDPRGRLVSSSVFYYFSRKSCLPCNNASLSCNYAHEMDG